MQGLQGLEHVVEVQKPLLQHLGLVCQGQYGLRDSCHRLACLVGGEVDGQVGQPQDSHERDEAFLLDKLPTVVVRRVVAQDGVDKLHDVVDIVYERDGLLLGLAGWYGGRGGRSIRGVDRLFLARSLVRVSLFLLFVLFVGAASFVTCPGGGRARRGGAGRLLLRLGV